MRTPLTSWLRRLRTTLTRRAALERDLDEEVRGFADELIASRIAGGMDPLEARRVTLAEMGGLEPVKEQVRDVRAGMALDLWLKDVALVWRGIRRSPGFSGVVVATLAIGIAGATTIFTQLNAVLLKPLAVDDPSQLRQISWLSADLSFAGPSNERFWTSQVAAGRPLNSFSYSAYELLRDGAAGVAEVACTSLTVRFVGEGGTFAAQLVTGDFFRTVGVRMALGRGITPADDRPGSEPVAVISSALWQRAFGGDPAVLGRTLTLRGHRVPIVGVMSAGFTGLDPANPRDVLLPYAARPVINAGQFEAACGLVARLHVPDEQARPALDVLVSRAIHAGALRQSSAPIRAVLTDIGRGTDALRDLTSRPLLLLLGAVGVLLAITCVNIAGMLLARAAAREREVATCLALGASRWRIARRDLTETFLLAAMAGVTGIAMTYAAGPLVPDLLGRIGEVPGGQAPARLGAIGVDVSPDWRVLAFALAVTALATIACAVVPALRASRVHLAPAITGGSRSTRWLPPLWSGGRAMLLAQVTLSMALLVASGLFVRSVVGLASVPIGYEPTRMLYVTINEVWATGGVDSVLGRLGAIPGVVSASASQWPLFTNMARATPVCVADQVSGSTEAHVDSDRVTPRFFESWGVPMIAGRDFRATDEHHAIVNETFARTYWSAGGAVGEVIGFGGCPGAAVTIVGVVADHRDRPRSPVTPMVYVPFRLLGPAEPTTLSLRTAGNAAALVGGIRRVAGELPTGVGGDVTTGIEYRDRTMTQVRLLGGLFSSFGVMAALLSALGLYGMLAFSVRRRTPEIGIRLAVGARRLDVALAVLRPSVWPVLGGVALGTTAALLLGRLVADLLFGVSSADPWTYAGAASLFVITTALAAIGPIVRASRIEPRDALRCE